MDATEFKHVERHFNAALELPVEKREAYLRGACEGEVYRRVKRMLGHADREVAMAPPNGHRPTRASLAERPGTAIGPYRIVEQIGEGGFGAVYLAEQERPVRRRVALKIIKLGMDTERVIARFEAERQALAMMDHSGIARVLDAGATETGRPFFVMELVDGVPLTAYAETHALSIDARIELFTAVCNAVQHAHQKGIIHRDLKPSNVMVTIEDGRPVPKVIDFGIAKAMNQQLTEKTIFTDFRQLVGTPAYMSPEQAELSGGDVDTRSDIYSLGVMLYELLTGAFPYAVVGNPHDVLKRIRTAEPVRPGRYCAELDDDVETILLKTLSKEPARRYQSAGELAADLDRSRAGLPIEARRDSGWYVLRTQLRRHRAAVAVATAFVVVLIASTVVAWTAYASADRARADATERLWQSYLAQARAARHSDRPGRRFESLDALAAAAGIRPSLELRDEAIACMTLFDVERESVFETELVASAAGLDVIDRVALGGDLSGIVRVVDAVDGRELFQLVGPPLEARLMQFSRDGRFLAVKYHTGREAWVRLWNLERREPLLDLPVEPFSNGFDFDASGQVFAVALEDATVQVFGLPSGLERTVLALEAAADRLKLDPSGRSVALASQYDPDIRIVDATTGAVTSTIATEYPVYALDWSRDGTRLAAAGADNVARIYDAATAELRATLRGHHGAVVKVHFGREDGIVATTSWDNTTRLWDPRTGRPMLGPLENVYVTGFGTRLALRTHPRASFSLWRVDPGREHRRLETAKPFGNVSLASSGGLLATAAGNGMRLWDLDSGRQLAILTDAVTRGAEFDGDRLLGIVDETLVSWHVEPSGRGVRWSEARAIWSEPGLRNFTVMADGRHVVGCFGSTLGVFDLAERRLVKSFHGYAGMKGPDASRDGRWIFTGTWKGAPARLWDATSGDVLLEVEGDVVDGFFSPDERWLIVARQGAYDFRELGTWRHHQSIRCDRVGGSVGFAPDGRTTALLHARSVARLVNASGSTLAHFPEPELQSAGSVEFTTDGRLLMATGNVIHVWEIDRVREGLRELGLDWQ